jgi:WD40 repeat protein
LWIHGILGSNECFENSDAMPIVSFALKSHKSSVNSLDFCQNFLLSGSDDRSARIWDLRTSKTSIAIRAPGEVTCVSFWSGSSHLGKKIPILDDKKGLENTPWAMNTSV